MIFISFLFLVFSFDSSWCRVDYKKYEPLEDHDLIQVHVVSRHGMRTPLHLSEHIKHFWNCNYTEHKYYGVHDKMTNNTMKSLKINVLYGKSLLKGDCHFSQLINEGNNELIKFGRYLRSVYIDKLKFLPSNINELLVEFRATNSHRTIHSSIGLISGIYPNSTAEIKIADKDTDILRRGNLVCPTLKNRVGKIKKKFIKESFNDKILVNSVSKYLQIKGSSLTDIIISSRCNNINLHKNVSDYILDDVCNIKAKQQYYVFSDPSVFPLSFSFPMSEILNHIYERISGNSTLRFKHWSGHNGNIVSFLGYLGVVIEKPPQYGAYVTLELWKARNNKYVIRFLYNGDVVTPKRFSKEPIVGLDVLSNFTIKNMPDIISDCGFNREAFLSSTVFNRVEK